MNQPRVIGAEHVNAVFRSHRQVLEIMAGDIVTDLARETAQRLGIRLVQGPVERPQPPRVDGGQVMMRNLYRRSPRWVSPRGTELPSRRFGRIGLVGAGGVGANIAHLVANADLADAVGLCDLVPGLAASVAMDLNHASGITGTRCVASGGQEPSLLKDAEVVIVTAGRPRTPGMSRADLIDANARVIRSSAESIKTYAPDAIVIVVTNPLDEMTFEMLQSTGFPRERVIGMAGTLDSSRFRHSLARAAGVPAVDVEAMTLGSHGDEMAAIVSRARIQGRPVRDFLTTVEIQACIKDAVTGGGQVVSLRKTGSATLAPAHASIELLQHIRGARRGSVPASIMLDGEYGVSGVVLGVPCHLGTAGVVSIDEIRLSDDEHQQLREAADAIRTRLGLV